MAGFGVGHARIIGYRSPNGLPADSRQSANGSAKPAEYRFYQGLCLLDLANRFHAAVSGRRWHPRVLADRWQTRIVVLAPMGTQALSPAAQDHDSGLRSRLVVGSGHGSGLFACVVGGEISVIPVLVSSHITRDLQVLDQECTD
jgi:hypothetical protein